MGEHNNLGSQILNELNSDVRLDLKTLNVINDLPYLDLLDEISVSCVYYDETSYVRSFSNSNKIIIMSCNIQSISAKFVEFNNLIDKMAEGKAKPDIILVQESFVQDLSQFNIRGFKAVLNPRPKGSRGGGTMIYYCNTFNALHLTNQAFFIPNILETSVLQVSIPGKAKFLISSLYRPNSHRELNTNEQIKSFFSYFECFLEILNDYNLPTIVGGDFNLNLFNLSDPNSSATELLNLCASFGFINIIDKATRIFNGSTSALDQMFINDTSMLIKSGIFTDNPSDHFSTLLEANFEKPKQKINAFRYSRDFSPANIDRFKAALSNQSWREVIDSTDTNLAFNFFLNTFSELYEIFFPEKRVKINKKYHKLNPFMSKGLIISRNHNLSLAKRAKKYPTEFNKNFHKSYRTMYNKLVRLAKKKHFNKKIAQAGTNSKLIWDTLREAINIPAKSNIIGPLLGNNNVLINDDKSKANFLNYFFSRIGEETSNHIPTTNASFRDFLPPPCTNSMFLAPISENTYCNFVLGIKPKTSKDINGLSMRFLHSIIYEIKKPLTFLFNLSVSQGIFPEKLKVSKSIPIFKSGDKTLATNYRLVSLVDNFSKPMEKIICTRLLDFFEKNKFFSDSQFGFRKGLSTKMAVLAIINFITKHINENKLVLGIFIDIMKAFDSVDHSILFVKLENAGVRGVALDWFKSYLSGRKQRVFLNNIFSDNLCDIILGVLQGSILGVILFLVMINDINNCCPDLFNAIFADDLTSLVEDVCLDGLIDKANNGLSKLVQWYSSNKFAIHPTKTKCMLFQASNKVSLPIINDNPYLPIFINLNNSGESNITKITPLKLVPNADEKSIKVLGVFLDDKLNFKIHMNMVHTKISRSLYTLKQMRFLLDGRHLKLLFSSYLKSHIDYCDIFYCLCNKSTLNPLEMIYKKAIRILSGSGYRDHTKPLFLDNKILPIRENSDLNILKLMYRCDHNNLPICLLEFWRRNRDVSGREGRNADKFYQETVNFKYLENHPFFYFPKLYNELSDNLKVLETEKEFTKQVKSSLLEGLV